MAANSASSTLKLSIQQSKRRPTSCWRQWTASAIRCRFVGRLKDGSAAEVGFADFFGFAGDHIATRTTFFYAASV